MISDSYFTLSEAADDIGVERHTIWRWVRDGRLAAEKVGREVLVKKSDLSQIKKSPRGRKRTRQS